MSLLLSIALAIASVNPEAPAERYASWVLEVAEPRGLDPWLVFEIVRRESRWASDVVRGEENGTCSVGLGQVNGPCVRATWVRPMLDPHANLRKTAEVLAAKRQACRNSCGGLGWVRGYNPGDKSYAPAVIAAVAAHHRR